MGKLQWAHIGDLYFTLNDDVTYVVTPHRIDGENRWGVWYPTSNPDDAPDEVHQTDRRARSQAQKHYDRGLK